MRRLLLVIGREELRRLAALVLERALPEVTTVPVAGAGAFARRLAEGEADAVVLGDDLGWGSVPELLDALRAVSPEAAVVLFAQDPVRAVRDGLPYGVAALVEAGPAGLAELPGAVAGALGLGPPAWPQEERGPGPHPVEEPSRGPSEEVLAAISHDLQEPLALVRKAAARLRKASDRLDPREARYLDHLERAAGRMQEMIDGVLEYARLGRQELRRAPVDLGRVVEAAMENLAEAITSSQAEVEVGLLPTLAVDERLMVHLFQNLIGNAIKFRSSEAPRIAIEARHGDGEWIVSVRDNGVGVPEEARERIFRMFARLHAEDEVPGTGMGLAICRRIAELHGGRIWVEAAPGGGSVFSFSVPETVGRWP